MPYFENLYISNDDNHTLKRVVISCCLAGDVKGAQEMWNQLLDRWNAANCGLVDVEDFEELYKCLKEAYMELKKHICRKAIRCITYR